MDWRIFTLINSIIALVTLIAVAFDFNAHHRIARANEAESGTSRAGTSARRHSSHGSLTGLADLRVDKLESVAPAELYELFLGATPDEMNALAMKFNELPPNVHTASAIGMFFQAWAELDGKSALVGAFRIKDLDLRRMAADAVVHSVSPAAAPELATYLTAHPDKDLLSYCQVRYLDALIERWSGLDPVGAAKFFDSLKDPAPQVIESALKNIAFGWGSLDPGAAIAWIDNAHDDRAQSLFYHVIGGWAKTDPLAATAYIAQHPDRPGATDAASALAVIMFKQGPDRATNWLNTLPAGELKKTAAQSLAGEWAQKDPVNAARWAESLPKGDQLAAVPRIAGLWAGEDWPAAQRWIATLQNDLRDEAIASAVDNNPASRVPPAESLPLAASIADQERRNQLIEDVIHNWADIDMAAAEAWVKRSSLSRQRKEELLSMLEALQIRTSGEKIPRTLSRGSR